MSYSLLNLCTRSIMFKKIVFSTLCLICNIYAMDSQQYKDDLVAEAFQSEAAFTNATDKKPIVATFGCGPCVAVGGYDSINNMAFMIHFATFQEVLCCGEKIIQQIRLLTPKKLTPKTPIILHLRGGLKGMSENTIKAICQWSQAYADIPMIIQSAQILFDNLDYGKSLSLDSRSGNVSDYDPDLNPHARKASEHDQQYAIWSFYVPHIRIIYTPQNL